MNDIAALSEDLGMVKSLLKRQDRGSSSEKSALPLVDIQRDQLKPESKDGKQSNTEAFVGVRTDWTADSSDDEKEKGSRVSAMAAAAAHAEQERQVTEEEAIFFFDEDEEKGCFSDEEDDGDSIGYDDEQEAEEELAAKAAAQHAAAEMAALAVVARGFHPGCCLARLPRPAVSTAVLCYSKPCFVFYEYRRTFPLPLQGTAHDIALSDWSEGLEVRNEDGKTLAYLAAEHGYERALVALYRMVGRRPLHNARPNHPSKISAFIDT